MIDDAILSLDQARQRRAERMHARAPSALDGEDEIVVDPLRYFTVLDGHAVLLGAQSRMLRNVLRQAVARTKSLVAEIDTLLGRSRERVRRCALKGEDCG